MSPWSRDRVHAELGPERVRIARFGRGSSAGRWEAALAPSEDLQQWSDALNALEAGLRSVAPTRPASLHVCLSNQFVRYAVLPWSDELRSESEVLAFARHRLREIYGEAVDRWEVALACGWPGVPRIAAAVERGLMEAIGALAQSAGLRLKSVQPQFVALADGARRELTGDAYWLAAAESGRIVLARSDHEEWVSLVSARGNAAAVPTLLALLTSESFGLAFDEIPKRLYLAGFEAAERLALGDAGWIVTAVAEPTQAKMQAAA